MAATPATSSPAGAPTPGGSSPGGHHLLAVAVGGPLGALARWQLGKQLAPPPGSGSSAGWPTGTLVVNLTGCLLIGIVMAALLHRPPTWRGADLLRPLLVTGFLGGYTTWSTFGVETTTLLQAHRPGLAAAYVVVSVVGALVAVAVAARLTVRLLHLAWPDAPLPPDAEE
ncbi:MAG: fluoride efflux transporter CrcB [Actinomycetales bacterium]